MLDRKFPAATTTHHALLTTVVPQDVAEEKFDPLALVALRADVTKALGGRAPMVRRLLRDAEEGHLQLAKAIIAKAKTDDDKSSGAAAGAAGTMDTTPMDATPMDRNAKSHFPPHDLDELKDEVGRNYLHVAAAAGQTRACAVVLKRGAMAVDKRTTYGFTPLMLAACWGRDATCMLLLDLGADPSATDRHGRTALEMASDGVRQHLAKHPAMRRAGVAALGSSLKAKHLERVRGGNNGGGGNNNGGGGGGDEDEWTHVLELIKEDARPKPGQNLSERHGCRLFSSTSASGAAKNEPATAAAKKGAGSKTAPKAAKKKAAK